MDSQQKIFDDKTFVQIVKIAQEVINERKKQFQKWGYQNRPPVEWIPILGEEFGEVSKEVVNYHLDCLNAEQSTNYRTELVQLAAVAMQMIQELDDQVEKHKYNMAIEPDENGELDLNNFRI